MVLLPRRNETRHSQAARWGDAGGFGVERTQLRAVDREVAKGTGIEQPQFALLTVATAQESEGD